MIISYLGWSIVWAFTYKQIKCNENKSSVQCIYLLTIKTVHDITEIFKDQTILLTFCLWYSYNRSTMNRLYIILIRRLIERYLDCLITIQKYRLRLVEIEAFIYIWVQLLAGDSEKFWQDAAEHVGRIFEVR